MLFSYPDKSQIVTVTTLNEKILKTLELNRIDHFVDLMSNRIIPDYLFNECEINLSEYDELKLFSGMRNIDKLLNEGVKNSWEKI